MCVCVHFVNTFNFAFFFSHMFISCSLVIVSIVFIHIIFSDHIIFCQVVINIFNVNCVSIIRYVAYSLYYGL